MFDMVRVVLLLEISILLLASSLLPLWYQARPRLVIENWSWILPDTEILIVTV